MLKKYQDYLSKNCIAYFWNRNNNLIGNISEPTLNNYKGQLNRIIADIERNSRDPYIIAKYLRKLFIPFHAKFVDIEFVYMYCCIYNNKCLQS